MIEEREKVRIVEIEGDGPSLENKNSRVVLRNDKENRDKEKIKEIKQLKHEF